MQAMSISEGRKRLFELRKTVVDDFEPVILTHKKGNVILISLEEYESMKETLYVMQDKRAWSALMRVQADPEKAFREGRTLEEVLPELAAELAAETN